MDINNKFRFFFDANITKSIGDKIENEKDLDFDNMYIAGCASDTTKDMQKETLDPDKFDLSYFMEVGKVNYNHTTTIVGEPREYEITPNKELLIKAYLYNSSPEAKQLYKQAWVMQSDPNSTRRLSWSIEANAIKDPKNKNKVLKVVVTGVALTFTPINYKNTFAEVVKAFSGENNCLFENPSDTELSIESENLLKSLSFTSNELINTISKSISNPKILELMKSQTTENSGEASNKEETKKDDVISADDVKSQIKEYISGTGKVRIEKLIKEHGKKKVINALRIGYTVENNEHSGDLNKIMTTALDHLDENINYYTESKPINWGEKEVKDEIKKSFYVDDYLFGNIKKKESGETIINKIENKINWVAGLIEKVTKLKEKYPNTDCWFYKDSLSSLRRSLSKLKSLKEVFEPKKSYELTSAQLSVLSFDPNEFDPELEALESRLKAEQSNIQKISSDSGIRSVSGY